MIAFSFAKRDNSIVVQSKEEVEPDAFVATPVAVSATDDSLAAEEEEMRAVAALSERAGTGSGR